MKRVIALALAGSLLASAGDFAILNVRVIEGEGMVYAAGGRATRGITVEVTDEAGRPVPDASVSFQLPQEGATGTFSNGTRSDVVSTRQDGRASVWGMKWGRITGTVQIRITVAKEGVRAGLVSTQYVSDTEKFTRAKAGRGGSRSKLLLIGVAVAGAAGGGLALGMARGPKPVSAPAAVALSMGIPSIIVGAP